ncbi:hypothetical protein Pcinc_002774 [Petrolisthes cinctipes]|uniref:SCAN box domain-containing protein n=1 Tax=Petrolisthes cinctipes TaxID=88211 RepID=A0AAE1GPP6_PETCI|nr:hypothetical protein Pcinc_002774 [Petrolisthes cinctipes]
MTHPTVDKLKGVAVSKDQWKILAFHYNVSYSSSATKQDIEDAVLEHLVHIEVIPSHISTTNLARSHSNSSLSENEDSIQILDRKIKLKEIESMNIEAEEKRIEAEEKRLEAENRKIGAENEKLKLELQLAQFHLQNSTITPRHTSFDLTKHAQLLGPFDEKDPDMFFTQFEKLATSLNWDCQYWTTLVQCKFVGKARKIYNSLSDNDSRDYTVVKNSVLQAYDQVEETYRLNFRNLQKHHNAFVEFANELGRLYDKWLTASKVSTFDELKELMLLEQFKFRVPPEVRMYLDEREIREVSRAAKLADTYVLTHRVSGETKRSVKADSYGRPPMDSVEVNRSERISGVTKFNPSSKSSFKFHGNCSFCKKPGHHITECWHPHCTQSRWYKPPARTESKHFQPSLNVQVETVSKTRNTNDSPGIKPSNTESTKTKTALAMNVLDVPKNPDLFHDFKSKGTVALDNTKPPTEIVVLRDTASAQSIICKDCLPFIENNYTDEDVILQDLAGYPVIPMVKIYLSTELIEGEVKVAVREGPMLVKGVDFILGNDLASSLVVPLPVVVKVPIEQSPTEDLEKEDPLLFPTCVLTRNRVKEQTSGQMESTEDCSGLQSLFLNQSEDFVKLPITTDNLIQAQHKDSTLTKIMSLASKDTKPDKDRPTNHLLIGSPLRFYIYWNLRAL